MTNDFWSQFGEAYLVFSKFCDFEDWQNILKRISREIIEIQANRQLALLDVGAGYGINTLNITGTVFSRSRIRNSVDIVEPSIQARETAERLLQPEGTGGILKGSFSNLADINQSKYDAIIFLHSTYYILDFQYWIKKLFNENLKSGGKILILALPDDSPFFVDSRVGLQNTSSKIKIFLSQQSFDYALYQLRSRLYINTKFVLSSTEANQLYRFMVPSMEEVISKDDFCCKLKAKACEGVIDLKDELIVIKKSK